MIRPIYDNMASMKSSYSILSQKLFMVDLLNIFCLNLPWGRLSLPKGINFLKSPPPLDIDMK